MTRPVNNRAHDWRLDSVCTTVDPEVFYPDGGRNAAAKAICAGCPVAAECLAFALGVEENFVRHERHGIFGGKSPSERHRLANPTPSIRERVALRAAEAGLTPLVA